MLRSGTPEDARLDVAGLERASEIASQWVGPAGTSALVVLVARHGVIALQQAFGRDEQGVAIGAQRRFRLGSASEPLTAACALALAEEGLLGLTRPVNDYLPESGRGMGRVLVAHLLCHTSGLEGIDGPPRGDAEAREAPGRVMAPCLRDYELLGEILERVGGDSIDGLARSRFFEPLGMGHTGFAANGGSIEASSTAGDLAAFLQMLLSHGRCGDATVLSRASVEAMLRNQTEGLEAVLPGGFRQRSSHYGFGFWGESDDRLPWSGGTLQSAGSVRHQDGEVFFWADPENDLIGVWLGAGRSEEAAVGPFGPAPGDADLFQNVVSAAVLDAADRH